MKILLFIAIFMLAGCSGAEKAATETTAQTFTVSVSGMKQFCPYTLEEESARQAMGFVYEPLYYQSFDGECIPVLASKTVQKGKYLDIYIKDNVLWHDYSPLTSEDVAYSINLAAGGSTSYSVPIIKNAESISPRAVRVLFEYEVKSPERYLNFPIIKNNFSTTASIPLGTGSMCYDERVSYDTFSFVPFDKYHGKAVGNKRLLIINAGQKERERSLFRAGATDVLYIEHDSLNSVTVPAHTNVIKIPTKHIIIIGYNCISLPESVRRAIFYAFDSQASAEQVLGESAMIFKRNDRPNIHRAHEEMKAGGFVLKGGAYCKISIAVQEGEHSQALGKELTSRLERFGIQCTEHVVENAKEDFKKGIYDMIITPWYTDKGLLELVERGNILLYENTKLDSLVHDGGDKLEIKNIIHRQMPFLPVAVLYDAVAVKESAADICKPVDCFAYYGIFNGEEI